MDSGVRPRDKTPNLGVAHCKLSPSQESENEQIQNQIEAHLFFDSQGIVHKESVPPGQIVNQTFYREVLERLRKRWHVCYQALHALGCCTTTKPHVTRQSPSMNFWQKNAFLWFLSPYSPDLSPCDFFLFPWLKNHLKGCHFGTLESIQKSVTRRAERYTSISFPALLRTMEKTPLSLCSCPRELF